MFFGQIFDVIAVRCMCHCASDLLIVCLFCIISCVYGSGFHNFGGLFCTLQIKNLQLHPSLPLLHDSFASLQTLSELPE